MNPLALILPLLLQSQKSSGFATQSSTETSAVLAAALAALATKQQPVTPSHPAPLPKVVSILAVGLLAAMVLVMAALIGVVAFGGVVGEKQPALVIGLAIFSGALITLTAAAVNFFFGSSIGSWQKNSWGTPGAAGGADSPVVLPAPTVPPQQDNKPDEPESGGGASPEQNPAPPENFPRVHEIIAKWEGRYSDDAADPGGATNYGITIGELGKWRGQPVTKAEVKALTYDEALKIFRTNYWEPLRCAEMPISVALMTYNCGVNSGISRGAKFLQECLNKQLLGVAVDGSIGPETLVAVMKADRSKLVSDYAATYEAFYRSLKTFPTFGKGWLNRLKDVTGTARMWITDDGSPATAPPDKNPTGVDVVALAKTRIGQAYANIQVPKDDAAWKGPWDCAEFASWLVYQVAGRIYGCTNDSDPPAKADAYTGAWKSDAKTIGRMISVDEAARTPGAFVLRYPPSSGAMGHIVVSDGKGGTIEAASTKLGLIASTLSGRRWDTGVLPPGIDYSGGSVVSVPGPATVYAEGQPNMVAAKVKEIQTALAAAGYSPGEADGVYGPATTNAMADFQRSHGLIEDGEYGPQTAELLGVVLT